MRTGYSVLLCVVAIGLAIVSRTVCAQGLVEEMKLEAAGAAADASYLLDGKAQPSIPIGWAVMSPMIVVIGDDQYAPIFAPCDPANPGLYCVEILRNGATFSERLDMGHAFVPAGFQAGLAYHPPLLFTDGTKLLIAYWVRAKDERSIVQLLSLDPKAPDPAPWTLLSTFENPGDELLSYLGGAMGPAGEIVIAGYGTGGPSRSHRLEITKILPPYTGRWMPKQLIAEYPSPAYAPEYPHVAIRDDGSISILTVLANYTPCPENQVTYSVYKNVIAFEGRYAGSFVAKWSDATADTVADPANHGDSCLFGAERYPLAHFWDKQSHAIYSIVRTADLDGVDAGNKVESNARFSRTFKLYRDGVLIVPDLAAYFSQYFIDPQHPCYRPQSACHIHAMTMTRLDSGEFVILANARDDDPATTYSKIGVIWSKDLHAFSEPAYLPTPYGPGYSIFVAQPDKNGMHSMRKLQFFNAGNTYNQAQINYNQRLTVRRYSLE
ncbi:MULTISPECIES: hypothetical protein [Bradyrhizobium]|uniref:Uncharacterized protein n=1 Tax=Bradyrhizobium elkanii TaxID=29448 RepID=A0A4U6S1E8_BRAEL|nr:MULTISPECIES: hypothetical protein [Bradyrhizobium]MTV17049.1 hypothetical protein [Bradyrhizobium sp. BR2003]TKV80718.1 hypothetical protein FDV58_14945 [Bradyrhizobium elkanii]